MSSAQLDAAATPALRPLGPGSAGLLPDSARGRLRVEWSAEREQRFQRAVTVVRALDRALPDRVRYSAARRTETR